MTSLVKSRKKYMKTRKNKSRKNKSCKTKGGSPIVDARSVKISIKKLNSLTESANSYCTPGQLSSSLPPAILAAKKAIKYANDNPGNDHAIANAEIKIKIADYWTDKCNKRTKWRNEKNLTPNHNARDWYEPGTEVKWKIDINEKAKKNMDPVLKEISEQVSLLPIDDERSEMGKEYRKGKRRFERRIQGLPSTSSASASP